MSSKYEIGKVYEFAFSRIAFWNDVRYIVLKDLETGSETMPGYESMGWVFRVPAYPFQCEWDNGCEWKRFQCKVIGFIQDCGATTKFPQLFQARAFVNEQLYGNSDVDEPLKFDIVEVEAAEGVVKVRDPATDAWYRMLAKDFGDMDVSVGKFVDVYPFRNKDGLMGFLSPGKHDSNAAYRRRQNLVQKMFLVNDVYECKVVSVDDPRFMSVKCDKAEWDLRVSYPPSGVRPVVGETVKLECVGYTDSHWPRLAWTGEYAQSTISVDMLPPLDLPSGGESKYVEYKSSLVYPAGGGEPDVDKQLGQVITRAVASFMNSEGGCIYVGVRDNGEICGIETEGALLSANSEDPIRYKQNTDGIQLKILNTIRQKLGDAAGALVDVRFKQGPNTKHLVCEIVVRANETDMPVYVDGKNLYVRYSGQTQRLEGESAARYIIDRLRLLDTKRGGKDVENSASAIEEMAQQLSKSLISVQLGGKGKKPATILGRPVVVADNTSVPLERLHVRAITNVGGLIYDGILVGAAKNWGNLYVELLRHLAEVEPDKFERLPDEPEFRGRGNRPAFARKGSRTRLRDASRYLGRDNDITADRRDGTRTGFYDPNGYPIRLIKHFGLSPERFRIWTGR